MSTVLLHWLNLLSLLTPWFNMLSFMRCFAFCDRHGEVFWCQNGRKGRMIVFNGPSFKRTTRLAETKDRRSFIEYILSTVTVYFIGFTFSIFLQLVQVEPIQFRQLTVTSYYYMNFNLPI